MIFVCVTLIGVKSKYGSCSRNCTGLININNTPPQKKKRVQIYGLGFFISIVFTYVITYEQIPNLGYVSCELASFLFVFIVLALGVTGLYIFFFY